MLKGSKTEKNLLAAFAGESQAYTKYQYYTEQAKKEGYQEIGEVFDTTAKNEKAHAKIWFKILNENSMPNTMKNLSDALAGEHYEWTEMYKEFAKTAREEGFDSIAFLFESVSNIEREHEIKYSNTLAMLEDGQVFKKPEVTTWICTNCGHHHEASSAPKVCPVCSKPQGYFVEKSK